MGCFYIESPSMRALLRKLSCDTFEMLTAASSDHPARDRRQRDDGRVHPPLPRRGGDRVSASRHGGAAVRHLRVMIYQEDVIKVAHRLSGMTLGEADGLRRSMSKKRDYEDFEAHRARFVGGALANGVERGVAEEIWRQIESFAGYSFCKAHSASYAQVSFQSAWLKTHYPAAFMASVLANGGGTIPRSRMSKRRAAWISISGFRTSTRARDVERRGPARRAARGCPRDPGRPVADRRGRRGDGRARARGAHAAGRSRRCPISARACRWAWPRSIG